MLVRHGHSAGNAALDAALAAHRLKIDLTVRDADVPLSEIGIHQAVALGSWFKTLPDAQRPNVMLVSPFVRALQTARHIEASASLALECPLVSDERLREKEFGLFDGLTADGIEKQYPQEAALRARVGKFYYRPPGGESWCDVVSACEARSTPSAFIILGEMY